MSRDEEGGVADVRNSPPWQREFWGRDSQHVICLAPRSRLLSLFLLVRLIHIQLRLQIHLDYPTLQLK